MCRTVTDAAILLGALRNPEIDAPDYAAFLDPNGLKGVRIGVSRSDFGFNSRVDKLMEDAIDVLNKSGAEIIDPANVDTTKNIEAAEINVLLYELKANLNAYLASLGPKAQTKTIKEIIEFNEKHADKELQYFGQELFIQAEEKGPLTDAKYIEDLRKNQQLAREQGIDAVMAKNRLDAIIAPTNGPAWVTDYLNGDHFAGSSSTAAAVAGYPNVSVPCGYVSGLPIGISFFGRQWSEPTLIKIAFAYEQATRYRRPPKFLRTLDQVFPSS
jgi:amidase